MSGTQDCVIAAGVESMSRVPMAVLPKVYKEAGLGHYMSPEIHARYPGPDFSQFMGAEMMAEKYKLTKEQLDRYALQSHQRARAATLEGAFKDEIVPVQIRNTDGSTGDMHTADEGIRMDATYEGIAGVKLLREGGYITAASASQICDGASGVMVVNERGLKALGVQAAGAHPPPERDRRRPGDHARGAAAGDAPCAEEGRHEDRRHRPVRDQRGLRLGAAGLAAEHRRRPGTHERQRRRHRARAIRWARRAPS